MLPNYECKRITSLISQLGYDAPETGDTIVTALNKIINCLDGIMSNKASIGRVVHYQRYGTPGGEHLAEPSPAIITKVIDEATQECQLFVMNPNGVYFNPTPYSDEPKPGHWNWPPRV